MIRRATGLALVVAVVLATVALAAKAGMYTGTTSQHQSLSLTVHGKRIVSGGFAANYGSVCGNTLQTVLHGRIKISSKGNFNATQHPAAAYTIHLSGRFKGSKVSGTLSVSFVENSIHASHTCKTGRVSFKAKLRPAIR